MTSGSFVLASPSLGSGDRICYHGVMDLFRTRRLAAATYASQHDGAPVLEFLSAMDIGDVYVFTNCDAVRLLRSGRHPQIPHPPVIVEDLYTRYFGGWDDAATSICEGDTYDVTRVVVEVVDGEGNVLVYAHEPVTVSVNGPVEVTRSAGRL